MIDRIVSNIMRKQEQDRTLEIGLTPIVAPFLALPGLIGFWPMSSVDLSSGDPYDISGQGRRMTYTGNPTYNIYNGITPYIDLDGTGDYLALADAADLDILGTETIYAAAVRGLTMGGWFWSDDATTDQTLMGKWNITGNLRAYVLNFTATGTLGGHVSSNGTAATTVESVAIPATGAWHFCVVRYTPSTELANFLDGVWALNTTSIPAALFNSSAEFQIGARSAGTVLLDGRASMCFLSANALSDALITSLFNETRGYFGV